jgi:hypothetical protein
MDQLKKSKTFIVTVVFAFCLVFSASAQIPRNISVALKAGNSASLSDHFNENIELTILEKDGIYSKTQAEQIVKDFFAANSPKVFNLLHEGGKGGAHYAIGELKTDNGTYRVYFLIKMINNQSFINQLRIEKN